MILHRYYFTGVQVLRDARIQSLVSKPGNRDPIIKNLSLIIIPMQYIIPILYATYLTPASNEHSSKVPTVNPTGLLTLEIINECL